MKINEIIDYFETFAPPGSAWEKDNIGLLVGDGNIDLKSVILTLDVNEEVVNYATKQKSNLIISHHPLIFLPLKNLRTGNAKADLIKKLIKNDINLFTAHTNLDFTKEGVSFALAEKVGLKNIELLKSLTNTLLKLVVFVPAENQEQIINKLGSLGAGVIGNYSNCTFSSSGTGTFTGNELTNPFLGKKERLEKVDEIRLEIVFNKWDKEKVIRALIEVHPYEEPAFDIYPLENLNKNFGLGAIGNLEKGKSKQKFLRDIKKMTGAGFLRYSEGKSKSINRVAVCGGSGKEVITDAIRLKADAVITSDINYHDFDEFGNKIMIVDAGHYYTEIHVLDLIEKKLKEKFEKNISIKKYILKSDKIKIYK